MPAVVITSQDAPEFEGKVTIYVLVCVLISAFGGFTFGYDIGISGQNFLDIYVNMYVFENVFIFFSTGESVRWGDSHG